jgi:hypothetical protein
MEFLDLIGLADVPGSGVGEEAQLAHFRPCMARLALCCTNNIYENIGVTATG